MKKAFTKKRIKTLSSKKINIFIGIFIFFFIFLITAIVFLMPRGPKKTGIGTLRTDYVEVKVELNEPPNILAVSHSPDPQAGGSSINFTSTASDPNPGDTIKLYICKYGDCSNCGPGNTTDCLAVTSTGVIVDPSASYTCPSPCANPSTNNYWAKVCDRGDLCSSIITGGGGSFSCKKEDGCSETDATKCYSGKSYDGVCCNVDCLGTCQACNLTGSVGTCTVRPSGDTTECDICKQCDGSNIDCQSITAANGKDCNQACTKCLSGSCVFRDAGDNVECSDPVCFECTGNNPDCQPVIMGEYTGPFQVWGTWVRWQSRDYAGNLEAVKSKQINVVSNLPPEAQVLTAQTQGSFCCGVTGYPPVILSWQYSDADGNDQSDYQVQIATNSGFTNIIDDFKCSDHPATCDPVSPSPSNISYNPTSLSWATTYYWRVKVWDSQGADSGWVDPDPSQNPFTTISHPYPYVDFDWSPQYPTKDEVVQFCSVYEEVCVTPCETPCTCGTIVICSDTAPAYTNRSVCYKGVGNTDYNYCNIPTYGGTFLWEIIPPENGTFIESLASDFNPKMKFTGTDVRLTITDTTGYSCPEKETVTVRLPLPKWKEIKPF
jgi:hypothetical protein